MTAKWSRRDFVKRAGTTAGGLVFGTALADFIAACSQGTTSGTSGGGKLEIFSWWTAGGEADGERDVHGAG